MVQPAVRSVATHVLEALVEWGSILLYALAVLFVFGLAVRTTGYLGHRLVSLQTYSGILTLLESVMFLMMLAALLHPLALAIRTLPLPLRSLRTLIFIAVIRNAVVRASTAPLPTAGAAVGIAVLIGLLLKIPSLFYEVSVGHRHLSAETEPGGLPSGSLLCLLSAA